MGYYYGWKPYVPVAVRRNRAQKKLQQMRKAGLDVQPVEIEGRKIARSFWGQAWCDHMESLGDFANRIPRGRTYVRNGSVCHLAIEKGRIQAIVSGSELYNVVVEIDTLAKAKWNRVKQQCSGHIGSLLELLEGRISDAVMEVVSEPTGGLFPASKEIRLGCTCPDYATMCKHLAAVLYGVGARLDRRPEALFLLRGVDHNELITAPADGAIAQATARGGRRRQVAADHLSDVFGIEMDDQAAEAATDATTRKGPKRNSAKKKPAEKKPAAKRGRKKADSPKSKTKAKTAPGETQTKQTKKQTKKRRAKKSAQASKSSTAGATKRAAKKKASTPKAAKQTPKKSGRPRTSSRKPR